MANDGPGKVLLYGYWRSSSSYRVRIALNLKGIDYEQRAVNLIRNGGEQHLPSYREINPLGLVPALVHDKRVITQSVAICEYLEEIFPSTPLLPHDSEGRARVRGIVQTIASEIQPLNNLGVMNYLGDDMGQSDESVNHWYTHWIERGFTALETILETTGAAQYCYGDKPTLADCYLVPQVYNAERFSCELIAYPNIVRITGNCRSLAAFRKAEPANQPDAP